MSRTGSENASARPHAPARRVLWSVPAGAVAYAGAWLALRSAGAQQWDVRAGEALRWAASPTVDRAVVATTDLGSMYAVLGAAAVLGATGRRTAAAGVLGAGTAAWATSQSSKRYVARARPYEADGVRRLIRPPTGSSFPSGHAAVGAAIMTVLAQQARRPLATRLFGLLGAYVPFTRVYAGVHYPSDVVAGAGLGMMLGSLWTLGRRSWTAEAALRT